MLEIKFTVGIFGKQQKYIKGDQKLRKCFSVAENNEFQQKNNEFWIDISMKETRVVSQSEKASTIFQKNKNNNKLHKQTRPMHWTDQNQNLNEN